jgi:hypothetical protein
MSNFVQYQVQDRVAVLTIDNPPVNAIGAGVPEGIAAALDQAEQDPEIRSVVLIGAGRTFVAGADITQFDELVTRDQSPNDPTHARDAWRRRRSSPPFMETRSAAARAQATFGRDGGRKVGQPGAPRHHTWRGRHAWLPRSPARKWPSRCPPTANRCGIQGQGRDPRRHR